MNRQKAVQDILGERRKFPVCTLRFCFHLEMLIMCNFTDLREKARRTVGEGSLSTAAKGLAQCVLLGSSTTYGCLR